MASAGRILIIPKGDYDANSTYDNLDLVKYKGTSWIAKKTVTGIEPSEANAEYWQDLFDMELANNLTTEETGYALDATQGKVLNDKVTEIRDKLAYKAGDTYSFYQLFTSGICGGDNGAKLIFTIQLDKSVASNVTITPNITTFTWADGWVTPTIESQKLYSPNNGNNLVTVEIACTESFGTNNTGGTVRVSGSLVFS